MLGLVTPGEVDLVMSDMAPNISGVKAVDQPRAMYLAELALDMASKVLAPGGSLLVKVFQGEGIDDFRRELKRSFGGLTARGPGAARAGGRGGGGRAGGGGGGGGRGEERE